jgi:hypothetical protein
MTLQLYQNLMQAILANDAALAANDILPGGKLLPAQRVTIYLDAYRLRLLTALRADLPASAQAIGAAAFDKIAQRYIEHHPSTSFNLDDYSAGFAAYAAQQTAGFLPDLLTLEAAINTVFRLPESKPLAPQTLQHLSPEDFGQRMLSPRRASILLAFTHDVDSYLSAQRAGELLPPPAQTPIYLYLYRHDNEVQRSPLTAASHLLLSVLFSGETIAAAINQTAAQYPDETGQNLQPWFADFMARGFFAAAD